MLSSLSVRQVVLIDKLDLTFESGLAVFTGETGAGKSILLDSLSLVLGARADASLVRHGEKQLSVTASFSLPASHPVFDLLSEQSIEADPAEEVVLRRIVTVDGKSKAYVNDEPVSVSFLKSLGDLLVEIHGQFASHRLLSPATHLGVLDAYAQLAAEKAQVAQLYRSYQAALKALETAKERLEEARRQEIYLRDGIAVLEELAPVADEEEALIARRNQLMNSEKIISCVNSSLQLLDDEDQGITHRLAQLESQLAAAAKYAPETFETLLSAVNEAQTALSDASGELENSVERFGDAAQLPAIDNRLFALRDAARRFRTEIVELPALLQSFHDQLAALEQGEEGLLALRKTADEAHNAYLKAAKTLSDKRRRAAIQLDKAVMKELPALKLDKAVFVTEVDSQETQETVDGIDSVCFTASTNKGVPPAPLHKMASGGELSRFMLALKVNLAQTAQTDTLVFDEVDSGVGGATAAAVGERLEQLGRVCQVLVVTHSPQVAACGQAHFQVKKDECDGRTLTGVTALSTVERLTEIARMLSGGTITQTAQTMARELLEKTWKKAS